MNNFFSVNTKKRQYIVCLLKALVALCFFLFFYVNLKAGYIGIPQKRQLPPVTLPLAAAVTVLSALIWMFGGRFLCKLFGSKDAPKLRRVYHIFLWILPFLFFLLIELPWNTYLLRYDPLRVLFNYALFGLFELLFLYLCRDSRPGLSALSVLAFVIGTANYYVLKFRGSPILAADITAASTAFAVAGDYTYEIGDGIARALLLLMLVLSLLSAFHAAGVTRGSWHVALPLHRLEGRRLVKRGSLRVLRPVISLAAAGCFSLCLFYGNFASNFAVPVNMYVPLITYREVGFVPGFMSFFQKMRIAKPEGYSANRVEDILEPYTAAVYADEETEPDVSSAEASLPAETDQTSSANPSASAETAEPALSSPESAPASDGSAPSSESESASSDASLPSGAETGTDSAPDARRTEVSDSSKSPIRAVSLSHTQGSAQERPTVIAIMNESFSDLNTVGPLSCTAEHLRFLKSLKDDPGTVEYGWNYVSTTGGGTSTTEFEFLTGNSMSELQGTNPYGAFTFDGKPSLVQVYKEHGYAAIAMHPEDPNNWRRKTVYPALGFDDFLSIDDFQGYQKTVRDRISDRGDYEKLLDVLKANPDPLFLFNVTMQNHGEYDLSLIPEEQRVTVDGEYASYQDLSAYESLIHQSDEALSFLIESLRGLDRPVLLCFFGDHQPNLDDKLEQKLSNAGKQEGEPELITEERRYMVPYFIWSNYGVQPSDVKTNAEGTDISSTNYLGVRVQAYAGLALSSYGNFLLSQRDAIPVLNKLGYYGDDGAWHSFDEKNAAYTPWIEQYNIVEYNALFDKKREEQFYSLRADASAKDKNSTKDQG